MTINSVFCGNLKKMNDMEKNELFFSLESIKLTVNAANWMNITIKYDQIGGKISKNSIQNEC